MLKLPPYGVLAHLLPISLSVRMYTVLLRREDSQPTLALFSPDTCVHNKLKPMLLETDIQNCLSAVYAKICRTIPAKS